MTYYTNRHPKMSLKYTKSIIYFCLFAMCLDAGSVLGQNVASRKIPFTFSLSASGSTSAGVYKKDGTLIRTLWSGKTFPVGTHTQTWDQLDDEGRLAADGNYDVRLLSNNVSYQWEGVIGNTSTGKGNSAHRWSDRIYDLRVIGNYAYFVTGYAEGQQAQRKFNLNTPGVMEEVWTDPNDINRSGFSSHALCNDGTTIYWSGYHPQAGISCVWATSIANGAEVRFSAGVPFNNSYGKSYASIINVINDNPQNFGVSGISGVAVSSTYLFVARPRMNSLQVLNKATGALVRSLTYDKPRSLFVDATNSLWMTLGTTATKHTINSDGTLSAPLLTISGLSDALSLQVSPDNNTVLIGDGGTNHVYRGYSNATGQLLWTVGKPGGYATSPEVAYDKFSFRTGKEWRSGRDNFDVTFGAMLPDGSMWLGDMGNQRLIRFDANRTTVLHELMNMGYNYQVSVVRTNPNRVFCNYLEFEVDYAKPLQPSNGSWKLKRNWSWNVVGSKDDQYWRTRNMVTLNNGRTYNLTRYGNTLEVVEYTATGLRYTGVVFQITNESYSIYEDGSLWSLTNGGVGGTIEYRRRPLTGFDSNNNPQFGPYVVVEKTPTVTVDDPVGHAMGGWNTNQYTPRGVLVSFATETGGLIAGHIRGAGYHLGGLKDGKWLWRTAKATHKNYGGLFPADGSYDIGNNVQYGGNIAATLERNIFWGYHGEFWKNRQTNKYNHFYDNGLFVGQFGVVGPETDGTYAYPGYAGNAIMWGLVKIGSDYYLYHSDEGQHGGLHRWKINNLASIREQITSISANTASETRGLMAQYYDGSDLNNFNVKTTRTDPAINFNWQNAVPSGTTVPNPSDFSVRWEGFLQSAFSENYTFSLSAYDGVRLWVDGKLLIDNWGNTTTNTFTGSTTLEADKRYAVRLEYANKTTESGLSLSWSSARQPKEIIPSSRLYRANLPDRSGGYELMEGVRFNNTLQNGIYGWSRNPATDILNSYTDFWRVLTNIETVNQSNPDLLIDLRPGADGFTATVTRDLGRLSNNVSEWLLTGKITWPRDDLDHSTSPDKGYFEVLDGTGKTIARFRRTFEPYPTMKFYGNDKVLMQSSSENMFKIMTSPQPFSITASNNGITFKYGNLPAVTTTVVDPTSNWQRPKSLQVFYYSGTKREHVLNMAEMRFSFRQNTNMAKTALGNDKIKFFTLPNPAQENLQIIHPTVPNESSLTLLSLNGQEIRKFQIEAGSETTKIDISSLPKGLYIVKYSSNIQTYAVKFVKN